MIAGNPATALKDPNSAVLSKRPRKNISAIGKPPWEKLSNGTTSMF
jgi:hypothetical protein